MDYLKSCTTNVLSLDGVGSIGYERYTIAGEDKRPFHEAIARLRERGILCSLDIRDSWRLWIFTARGMEWKQEFDLKGEGFSLEEEGTLERYLEKDGKEDGIKGLFLSSVEGMLSLALSSQGIYRIGHWIWLYASNDAMDGSTGIMLKLHPHITPEGALRISTTTSKTGLRAWSSFTTPTSTEDLILAPSGRRAKLIVQGADAAFSSLVSGDLWMSTTMELLRTQVTALDPKITWLPVRICDTGSSDCVMWPAALCFHNPGNAALNREADAGPEGWRQWFSNPSREPYQNPLVAAQAWHSAASTFLDEDPPSVDDENDMYDNDSADVPFGIHVEDESAPSPPVVPRVVDQQAALVGIYPTPPDGLTSMAASQQPTFDGIDSAMQIDQAAPGNDLLTLGEDPQTRERSTDSLEAQTAYQPSRDDLFGDMGEMDFADNEVGDDDFAYFDEPDETPGPAKSLGMDLSLTNDPDPPTMIDGAGNDMPDAEVNVSSEPPPQSYDEHDEESAVVNMMRDATAEEPAAKASEQFGSSPELMETNIVDSQVAERSPTQPEKPLSPFGIRERLLPPPIPASAKQSDTTENDRNRRPSLFASIAFNDGLDLRKKYAMPSPPPVSKQKSSLGSDRVSEVRNFVRPNKDTPQTSPRPRILSQRYASGVHATLSSSESDEDLLESDTSMSEDDEDQQKPWEYKQPEEHGLPQGSAHRLWEEDDDEYGFGGFSLERVTNILNDLIPCDSSSCSLPALRNNEDLLVRSQIHEYSTPSSPSLAELLDFKKDEVAFVAQIISTQAVCATSSMVSETSAVASQAPETDPSIAHAVRMRAKDVLRFALPDLSDCDLAQLAAAREVMRPTLSQGKAPSQPAARAHHRADSVHAGPDYFPLPPPYVRIQRGTDDWEMLPPALQFWSVLSLGPANGEKHVQVVGISPSSEELLPLVHAFMEDLGTAYDSRKMGSWSSLSDHDALKRLDNFEEGIMAVTMDDDTSYLGLLKAYAKASVDLGKALAKTCHLQPDRTIVVCMVDPFEDQGKQGSQYLCACLLSLYKAFGANIPKSNRDQPHSDLVLQLLPIELIASPGQLVNFENDRLGDLATDIYDRCPPSSSAGTTIREASTLSIACAPSVEIAVPPPKRINFQLSADPPNDLLHEGSILHLAYAVSPDKHWMTAHWIDSTGRNQDSWATCCRGRGFIDVAQEVWDKTLTILEGRAVTWRVFIAAVHEDFEDDELADWREVVGNKPRKQALLVTLLAIQRNPELQLYHPLPPENMIPGNTGQGAGVFTPASTPQGTALTASPDASGQINAPPTPAASDGVTSVSETDPDALLVDMRDESWGMLLPWSRSLSPNDRSLSGLLFKRGDPQSWHLAARLDAIEVTLRWDLRVRTNGTVDDGLPKQAEVTLREVLRMYRSLGVLSRAKGLRGLNARGEETNDCGMLPLHVIGALRAAKALNGLVTMT